MMIGGHLFLSAVGLGVAYNAAPGAVNTEALRRGLARGYRAALLVELGALIGDATCPNCGGELVRRPRRKGEPA